MCSNLAPSSALANFRITAKFGAFSPCRGKTIIHHLPNNSHYRGNLLDRSIIISFGTVLRRLRKERNLTQDDLGRRSNVQGKHISCLELGEKEVSLTTLYKLAYGLTLPPAQLVSLIDRELGLSGASPTKPPKIEK